MPPTNPLENAIRSAARANETLARMFARAGSVESGRGYVVSAYRTANRALKSALQESNRTLAVWDTIRTLKASLRNDILASMQDASAAGLEEAARQLRYYGIESNPINLPSQVDSAVEAVMAQVNTQEQILMAYLATGLDDTLITGDESRQGVLRPSDILVGAAFWIAALTWDSFGFIAENWRIVQDIQVMGGNLNVQQFRGILQKHGLEISDANRLIEQLQSRGILSQDLLPDTLIPQDGSQFKGSVQIGEFSNFSREPVTAKTPGYYQFKKQAIATLDARTTDCCLRVHGQIQPFARGEFELGQFELTGTPRFADLMEWSPFHWYAIVAGEMCITDRGNIPIENIKIGDMVLTHKGRYKPVTMTLSRVYTGKGLLIETTGGEIKITPEHPVLTTRGWIKAGNLQNGDVILGRKHIEDLPDLLSASIGKTALDVQANYLNSHFLKIFVSQLVSFFSRVVPASIKFKIKFKFGKIKVKNVFSDWLLKLKILIRNEAAALKGFKKTLLCDTGVFFPLFGKAFSLLFLNPFHAHGVPAFHSSGSHRIGNSNTGMGEPLPFPNSRFFQAPSLDAGLIKASLDNISGNTKFLSDGIFSRPSFIQINNGFSVDVHSSGHSNLLYSYYTVKNIKALVLQDNVICDLSVQDDESYCVAGHYVHNCRTAITLYQPEYDTGLTERMRSGAGYFLSERAAGRKPDQNPSAFLE